MRNAAPLVLPPAAHLGEQLTSIRESGVSVYWLRAARLRDVPLIVPQLPEGPGRRPGGVRAACLRKDPQATARVPVTWLYAGFGTWGGLETALRRAE